MERVGLSTGWRNDGVAHTICERCLLGPTQWDRVWLAIRVVRAVTTSRYQGRQQSARIGSLKALYQSIPFMMSRIPVGTMTILVNALHRSLNSGGSFSSVPIPDAKSHRRGKYAT